MTLSRRRSLLLCLAAGMVGSGIVVFGPGAFHPSSSAGQSGEPGTQPASTPRAGLRGAAVAPDGKSSPAAGIFAHLSEAELRGLFGQLAARPSCTDSIGQLQEIAVELGRRGRWLAAVDLIASLPHLEARPGGYSGRDRESIYTALLTRCEIPGADISASLPAQRDHYARRSFIRTLIGRDGFHGDEPSALLRDFIAAVNGPLPEIVLAADRQSWEEGGSFDADQGLSTIDCSGPVCAMDRYSVTAAIMDAFMERLGPTLPANADEAGNLFQPAANLISSLRLTTEDQSPLQSVLSRYVCNWLPVEAFWMNCINCFPDGESDLIAIEGLIRTGHSAVLCHMRPPQLYTDYDVFIAGAAAAEGDPVATARRDAVAQGISAAMSEEEPDRARDWAEMITDPAMRAEAEKKLPPPQ